MTSSVLLIDDHPLFRSGVAQLDYVASLTHTDQHYDAIVEALNNGGTAAMIDVDHNGPDHTSARLLLLGANINDATDRFIESLTQTNDGKDHD